MSDRPILFSGPMVRALLDGSKTQTRRLMPHQEELQIAYSPIVAGSRILNYAAEEEISRANFQTGDRIYVRETFSGPYVCTGTPPRDWPEYASIWYWADGQPEVGDWTRPKPGIHMPRWASRLTLTVTDVRVQRLQDISEVDAIAEGCRPYFDHDNPTDYAGPNGTLHQMAPLRGPVDDFTRLWDSLNADRAPWASNPWVCAVSFTVHRSNIDQMEAA